VRTVLIGVGLASTVGVALSPELRRSIIEAVAEHIPQDLLDEFVLDAEVVPDTDDTELEATDAGAGEASPELTDHEPEPARKRATGQRQRRPANRTRGDTNGQSGRKPPKRGTRA
jgi:hypothetical protein